MDSFREQLLQVQRQSYRRLRRQVMASLTPNRALMRYEREYLRHVEQYQSVATFEELHESIRSSRVVYHGDYHTLRQSQRAVLHLLRQVSRSRRVVLCLEMFRSEHQKHVDRFLNGRLSEKSLLKAVDYVHTWEFKWVHWRPLVLYCRDNGIPIVGINAAFDGPSALRRRDRHAARIIANTLLTLSSGLVWVVDGEYHVSPGHLPVCVERALGVDTRDLPRTILCQNADNLYWALAEEGREDARLLQLSNDSFCLMNTTPTNKLQSYANWLEYADDAYYPVNSDWEELTDVSDTTTIPNLVRTYCDVLGLPYPQEALERLTVYYADNLAFFDILNKSDHLRPMIPFVRRKIRLNEGFLIEYGDPSEPMFIVYLATSSLNMAAEEAMHLLHAVARHRPETLQRVGRFDRFYRTVITEAIGFFGSKLINGRREAPTIRKLQQHMRDARGTRLGAEQVREQKVCRLILAHCRLVRRYHTPGPFRARLKDVLASRSGMAVTAATQLGYMLGERLFRRVKQGRFPTSAVVELMHADLDSLGSAFSLFVELASRVRDPGASC